MTPSQQIVAAAETQISTVDKQGRRLSVRRLMALDRLRLFKAAGPVLSQNQPWLGMAVLASSVTAIDDIPVPPPVTEQQIEALVAKLGDDGISAVAGVIASWSESQPEIEPGN